MLVLNRKVGEAVVIGGNVRVIVGEICGKRVKLVIDAPRKVEAWRSEILEAREREKACSS
jgi:carbon storage regulator